MFHVNYMHDPLPKHKWLLVIFYCCMFILGFHFSGSETGQYFYCTCCYKLHEKVQLDVISLGFKLMLYIYITGTAHIQQNISHF